MSGENRRITLNYTRNYAKIILVILFFVTVLSIYIHHVTRDVYSGDIGDLVTAAFVFGVPHPPGYPLLTFLGFLFTHIPFPLPPVARMSLISAVTACFGTFVYFLFCIRIYKDYFSDKRKEKKKVLEIQRFRHTKWDIKKVPWEVLVASLLATSVLAFSYMYWLYAEVPEVFALSNFFLILLYFFAYLWYHSKKILYLYLVAFIAGLSLTNQHAILSGFPGIALFVLPGLWRLLISSRSNRSVILERTANRRRPIRSSVKDSIASLTLRSRMTILGKLILFFILGLLPYIYVFIAASTNPPVNWMGEPTVYNLIRLLLRLDYTFFKDPIGIVQRLVVVSIYFSSLYHELSLIIISFCILGFLSIWKKDKFLFWVFLIGFFFAGPIFIFVIAPGINDPDDLGVLERFYMHSYIIFLFLLPFGVYYLQQKTVRLFHRNIYAFIFLLPIIITVAQMFFYNNQKTDLSKTQIGSNFAYDILSPLPKNTLLFPVGDTATLNSWYVHYVLGYRKDVIFMGVFGDRSRFEKKIVNDFKKRNPKTILKDFEIVKKYIPSLLEKRPIHSMYLFPVSKEYIWMPVGLSYELIKRDKVPTLEEYKERLTQIVKSLHIPYRELLPLPEQNNITPYTSRQYSYSVIAIGDFFYLRYGDRKSAYLYYKKSQDIDPDNSLPYAKIAILQGEDEKQCNFAIENIDRSIKMYRIYKPYYTFALRIYKKCNASENKIGNLKEAYKELFGKDLEKDPHY